MTVNFDTDDMDRYYDAPSDTWRVSGASPFLFACPITQDGAYVAVGATAILMVSFYFTSTDTEEIAYINGAFQGVYDTAGSTTDGTDYVVYRRGGWPTGAVALKIREIVQVTDAA